MIIQKISKIFPYNSSSKNNTLLILCYFLTKRTSGRTRHRCRHWNRSAPLCNCCRHTYTISAAPRRFTAIAPTVIGCMTYAHGDCSSCSPIVSECTIKLNFGNGRAIIRKVLYYIAALIRSTLRRILNNKHSMARYTIFHVYCT